MSFKAIKVNKNLTRTLLVEQLSEIENGFLPTNTETGVSGLTNTDNGTLAIGSIAMCLEDNSRWVLSPSNVWTKTSGLSSGGGSGDSCDHEIITEEEIDGIIDSLI